MDIEKKIEIIKNLDYTYFQQIYHNHCSMDLETDRLIIGSMKYYGYGMNIDKDYGLHLIEDAISTSNFLQKYHPNFTPKILDIIHDGVIYEF